MRKRISLTRQLALVMAALAMMAIIATSATFYIVYAVLERLHILAPSPPGADDFTGLDFGILLTGCLFGAMLALGIALWISRRIVHPLRALGEAARRIAGGDLATRVDEISEAHGETALLIADFNAMAGRLQGMSEDLSTWNAQIAHELRTPLTILRGRLQGVQDGVFPLDAQLIAGLLQQVDGLTRLVEDLRSVSLADSGRLELMLTEVDLAGEVHALAPTLAAMLAPAGFGLALDLQPGTIQGDPARLRQAIIALVENARCHADPCVIRIETYFTDATASVSVIDEGPGLRAGFENRAFDPFARDTQRTQGTGLGLAVVRAIARAHGGDAAYGRTRTQSIFRLTLPLTVSKTR
ncbi:sensor histidine kinase [Sphingomonas sp. ABOLE]|uniref:ATP-binding protein n=1 Tax=Sphingomonas sp. ABOLE TaxID=1985878 RepID=UPI000F7E4AAE|nr:ATP-binding protein [Sphingomonas sp. ABOLE]RSV38628.1 sensor histidine kinase [Sphingomonas sp. ABOLE]